MKVQPFLFAWLKDHIGHYQFRTEEARQLRDKIKNCRLNTPEGETAYSDLYMKFSDLLERNPFSGQDRNGKDAAILTDCPAYLFYPNDEGLYQPLDIFFRFGGVSEKEDADKLRARLGESVRGWAGQVKEGIFRRREQFHSGRDRIVEEYGKLLTKGISSHTFWMLIILVLFLSCGALALGAAGMIIGRGGLFDNGMMTLKGIALAAGTGIALLFIIKSISWMKGERRRQRLIENWKRYSADDAEEDKEDEVKESFRNPRRFQELLDQAFAQAEHGEDVTCLNPEGDPEEGSGAAAGAPAKAVNYDEYLDPKGRNIKICNTVRPLHVLVAALALVTVSSAGPVAEMMPLSFVSQKMHEWGEEHGVFTDTHWKFADKSLSDPLDGLDLSLAVTAESANVYVSAGEDQSLVTTVNKGAKMYPTGASQREDDLWIRVTLPDGTTGSVKASDVRLFAFDEMRPADIAITGKDGTAKTVDASLLTDGDLTTGILVETGDTISLKYSRGFRFDGLMLSAFMTDGNGNKLQTITKARIVFDGIEEYYINTDYPQDGIGIVCAVPDVTASGVEITVEGTGRATNAALCEILLGGQRLR